MKIAINCSFCQPKGGGITEYIVNLINHLEIVDQENEYILYVLKDMYEYCLTKLPNRFRIKQIPYENNLKSIISRSLFSQSFWYKEEEIEMFEIFHSPFFYAPKFRKAKILLTVHDLRLYRFPSTYGFLRYIYLQYAVKESIKRANRIISISQFTKDEIVKLCKVNPDKINVILEAINRDRFCDKQLIDFQLEHSYEELLHCRFILSVGHIEPRKNYKRLIDAFNILKQDIRNKDIKLVIVGKPNNSASPIIKKMKETKDVIYLNFVSFQLLLWLYKHASLFVFPSIYEGFGFPPMEAGSLGTLSAVSNVSSMPEVCGNCSIYFDPYNIQDMANKMSEGLYNIDYIEKVKTNIESNLARFSWQKNAEQTLEIYRSI